MMLSRSLPIVNNTNNIQNSIPAINHLAIVPHNVVPTKMTAAANNNSSIVHKWFIPIANSYI